MNLKKIGKVFMSKSVGTRPSSYEKSIYRAAVSQRLKNTGVISTETGYRLDGPGIKFRWGRDFLYMSRLALGSTQPPVP